MFSSHLVQILIRLYSIYFLFFSFSYLSLLLFTPVALNKVTIIIAMEKTNIYLSLPEKRRITHCAQVRTLVLQNIKRQLKPRKIPTRLPTSSRITVNLICTGPPAYEAACSSDWNNTYPIFSTSARCLPVYPGNWKKRKKVCFSERCAKRSSDLTSSSYIPQRLPHRRDAYPFKDFCSILHQALVFAHEIVINRTGLTKLVYRPPVLVPDTVFGIVGDEIDEFAKRHVIAVLQRFFLRIRSILLRTQLYYSVDCFANDMTQRHGYNKTVLLFNRHTV